MALATLIGFIVGWLRGGSLSNLAKIEFRFWWLIVAAALIQASFPFLIDKIDYRAIFAAYLASFALIAVALVANLRRRFVPIILAGIAMNIAVIALNGGMPFYSEKYRSRASEMRAINGLHVPASEKTRLGFLGDWIPIPPPYPQPAILSPGDIVVSLGLFLFIQAAMVSSASKGRRTAEA